MNVQFFVLSFVFVIVFILNSVEIASRCVRMIQEEQTIDRNDALNTIFEDFDRIKVKYLAWFAKLGKQLDDMFVRGLTQLNYFQAGKLFMQMHETIFSLNMRCIRFWCVFLDGTKSREMEWTGRNLNNNFFKVK